MINLLNGCKRGCKKTLFLQTDLWLEVNNIPQKEEMLAPFEGYYYVEKVSFIKHSISLNYIPIYGIVIVKQIPTSGEGME